MNIWYSLLIVSSLTVAYAHHEPDHGDYGYFNNWKNVTCNFGDRDALLKKLDECIELEPNAVKEAFRNCLRLAYLPSNGKLQPFYEIACEIKSIFMIADECLRAKGDTKLFPPKDVMGEKAYNCFKTTLEENGLQELLHYLNRE